MTPTTLTSLAAREHVNDLLRDAERRRGINEVAAPHRTRLSISRRFARRVARPATA
jgi:hypothetical protein